MTSSKAYLKLFNACPIKVGDTVRVLRGWKGGEYGYNQGEGYPILDIDYNVSEKTEDSYIIETEKYFWDVPFFVLEVVKPALVNTATSDDYLAFHKASGLKVGDKVKITRKVKDYEMGWDNEWVNIMDSCIGDIGEIIEDKGGCGWLVNVRGIKRYYPTFALQKIDNPAKKEKTKPAPEEILIKENSVVVNGCELTKEQVGALYYKLVRKGKKKSGVGNQMKHKVHNPDKLTPEQIGVSEGYRLLDEDEIKKRISTYEEVEMWTIKDEWFNGCFGCGELQTYRTKLSRKQLAKLK